MNPESSMGRVGDLKALCVTSALVVLGAFTVSAAPSPQGSTTGRTERIPVAAVVSGMPQGMFVGRSLLTGRAVCLLFLSGGRVTRAIPAGGLERFDWARHQADHRGDVGEWQAAAGEVRIVWGDGSVHQGPLRETPEGIEFYGKRYSRPALVEPAALAGRWQAARGTAIAGGQGVNVVSSLVIDGSGRFQWMAATGGVVSGRATANERSLTGTIQVSAGTLTLRADDGTTSSYTFVPVAGRPLAAFSLDADMFTRE